VIVVDASVWVSRFSIDDHQHAASRAWLDRYLLGNGHVTCPVLVLAEVAGGIARRTGRARLAERAVNDLLSLSGVRLARLDFSLAAEAARLATSLRLRGADATYVATAHRLGIPLITWDREQRERAASVIPTYEPGATPS
jgi:predicted nucleic acid-binding protein